VPELGWLEPVYPLSTDYVAAPIIFRSAIRRTKCPRSLNIWSTDHSYRHEPRQLADWAEISVVKFDWHVSGD
jgi:hypothetical protein